MQSPCTAQYHIPIAAERNGDTGDMECKLVAVWIGDTHLPLVKEIDDVIIERLLPLGTGLTWERPLLFLHC